MDLWSSLWQTGQYGAIFMLIEVIQLPVPFLIVSQEPYLSDRLGVLPLELNKLLIIVVVLSMALTPLLNEIGRKAGQIIDEKQEGKEVFP